MILITNLQSYSRWAELANYLKMNKKTNKITKSRCPLGKTLLKIENPDQSF